MPNIAPIDLDRPGPAGHIIAGVKAKIGAVPNIFATMAQSPAALKGYLAFSGALAGGALDAGLREQIALAVAGENQCDYCASAHAALAKGAGIDQTEAALNLTGKASDPRVAAIIGFARDVVRSRGRIDARELNKLRVGGVSEEEIVEVLAHIGLNLFTNYFNHVADTVVDFPLVTTSVNKSAA